MKSVVITPSDKTKRLITLDSESYDNMANKSTIDTGNYKPLKRLNLPRTEQINFNKVLNKVANKYKSIELKGRPIHAATDTPATRLSSYLAKQLNMLLRYVPAHLRNTADFIDCIYLDCNSVHGFCSLDVCNLYGSIPLDDLNVSFLNIKNIVSYVL